MSIRMSNSCFVHIPRTGGLWFGDVVESLGIKHQRLRGDIDSHLTFSELPDNWRRLVSFTFVRHPLKWIKSRWSHCVEHNLKEDYRCYGIHREFDECVEPDFVETLKNILACRPGIVGETYSRMSSGVTRIYRTEDIPQVAYSILSELEGVGSGAEVIIRNVPKVNSTATLTKYEEIISKALRTLINEFLESESIALQIWKNAISSSIRSES